LFSITWTIPTLGLNSALLTGLKFSALPYYYKTLFGSLNGMCDYMAKFSAQG
jgi:hypothetical protein